MKRDIDKYKQPPILPAVRKNTAERDRPPRLRRLSRQQVAARAAQLSKRDLQTMRMIYDGLSNKVIANRLEIGLRTVESARARIFRQLGVETAVDLVRVLALADYYEEAVG